MYAIRSYYALPDFHSYAAAKSHIVSHNSCGALNDQQAQAIAIYLVDKNHAAARHPIAVPASYNFV